MITCRKRTGIVEVEQLRIFVHVDYREVIPHSVCKYLNSVQTGKGFRRNSNLNAVLHFLHSLLLLNGQTRVGSVVILRGGFPGTRNGSIHVCRESHMGHYRVVYRPLVILVLDHVHRIDIRGRLDCGFIRTVREVSDCVVDILQGSLNVALQNVTPAVRQRIICFTCDINGVVTPRVDKPGQRNIILIHITAVPFSPRNGKVGLCVPLKDQFPFMVHVGARCCQKGTPLNELPVG